jgi:glycosyltransferase involved in cell wall biosynthesis
MSGQMRGLYVTDGVLDARAWSGTSMCLYGELTKRFSLETVEQVVPVAYEFACRAHGHLPGRRSLPADRTLLWRRRCANRLAATCAEWKPDFIMSPGSLPIALLDVDVPKFCYVDGTVRIVSSSYGGWERIDLVKADALESDALGRAALIFSASEWCARSLRDDYGISPSSVDVVGIGANNEVTINDFDGVICDRAASLGSCIRLLFVGVDWERKGGLAALETLRLLLEAGLSARLDVVGCEPDIPEALAPHVTVHGFLSKEDSVQRARLEDCYVNAHFFILPTTAECVGSVFCEASSAGLPVLACDVGGVGTVVAEGRNGFLRKTPRAFADVVCELARDQVAYKELELRCRRTFEERLNWGIVGERIACRIEECLRV